MRTESRIVRKFAFSDLTLAYKVRGIMREELIKFDANGNERFEENEIKQAMITILGESENELHYVVKNVFRYDRDNDKMVTYDELTNFSVEQHFGEMAIQRLHRKNQYSQGAQRRMNREEFANTLNHCLSPIRAQGSKAQYDLLFSEVDLDRDGWISYEDYFIFLREYFGSQSIAFERPDDIPVAPPAPVAPKQEPDFIDGNGQSPEERFAKLIYSQFKISVMEKDRNKNLVLEVNEVEDILSNVLKMSYTEITQQQDKLMGYSSTARYEDFMKNVVVYYLTEADPKKNGLSSDLGAEDFIKVVLRATHFVNIKPAEHVLKACFENAGRGRKSLSKDDYINLMRRIFGDYQFDQRGLPRTSQVSSFGQNNGGYQQQYR